MLVVKALDCLSLMRREHVRKSRLGLFMGKIVR